MENCLHFSIKLLSKFICQSILYYLVLAKIYVTPIIIYKDFDYAKPQGSNALHANLKITMLRINESTFHDKQ